jgi:hypothetical protein
MIDNLIILSLGGIVILAIFVIAGVIAKVRGWE